MQPWGPAVSDEWSGGVAREGQGYLCWWRDMSMMMMIDQCMCALIHIFSQCIVVWPYKSTGFIKLLFHFVPWYWWLVDSVPLNSRKSCFLDNFNKRHKRNKPRNKDDFMIFKRIFAWNERKYARWTFEPFLSNLFPMPSTIFSPIPTHIHKHTHVHKSMHKHIYIYIMQSFSNEIEHTGTR